MRKALILFAVITALIITACNNAEENNTPTNNAEQTTITQEPDNSMEIERAADNSMNVTVSLPEQSDADITGININGWSSENTLSGITIAIGDSVFPATLYDNETTRALIAMFPMTLDMSDLHDNEKYYYLPEELPTDNEQVGSIQTGDLMLYGSACIVLFYDDFSTSYSYTRLGYIEDTSGLSAALGNGSVEVTFAINN